MKRNLPKIHELYTKEIGEKPRVFVVWADPEVGRLWLFQQLIKEGLIERVISRPKLPGEGSKATTFCESHNIQVGLEYLHTHFSGLPIVFQCVDVLPKPGAYSFVRDNLREGHKAVLFLWENSCIRENIWSTQFWGLSDIEYAPPISPPDHPDVLERQWGMKLIDKGLGDFLRWNNFGHKIYTHDHISEGLEEFPVKAQFDGVSITCYTKGYIPWYIRLGRFLKRAVKWLKWW